MTLPALRELLKDERTWCVAARVAKHDGETSHWYVADEGHLIVTVLTLQHSVPIDAILRGGDNQSTGVWTIPCVGTEVLIEFDNGDFEGDAFLVGVHGNAPPSGLDDKVVLVIGDNVEIRSVSGTARPLAFKSDVEAVDAKYAGHLHPSDGTPPVATVVPNPGPPPTYLPGAPLADAGIEGTTNLKAT